MLHTVNKSPFDRNSLESCLKHAKKGAAILLIEDGIYGALKGTAVSKKVEEALKKVSIYALYPDIEARGMQDRALDGIKLIDYSGFVDLVAEHNTVQSWL
ncbi:MAG: sulfurtransferase TusB [Candidatus Muproteobacteria bacterium RBG_19FT_COMBO_61_10]|jgi:tRNA 2-thiouridine synthesizing protein B|uniref:Sulfurtransferase TusB n=1 Tax=Candidatus Muproteobacteria bacterium RBG_19FT_COMBO_61_10 TaxID=1817761 RepID=A0A1F6UHB5_9PROT|nr:MAG: sulfurtransferase TusB [Candidatus Muproteobacteria bacterium RBG_19FT_COMBO_61_10]